MKLLPNTTYIYQDPVELGYKKINLTRKDKKYLGIRPKWQSRYVLFYREDGVIVHTYYTKRLKATVILLFPVIVAFEGITNFWKVYREVVGLVLEKKYGTFVQDRIWPEAECWEKIEEIVRKRG